MSEYIERESLIGQLEAAPILRYGIPKDVRAGVIHIAKGQQAADVAPVKHGRWKLLHKGEWTSVYVCSICGRRETIMESESYNSAYKIAKICPYCHCGARMDGDST